MLDQLSLSLDTSIEVVSETEEFLTNMRISRYNVHENFKNEIVDIFDKLSELVDIVENCKTLFLEVVEGKSERNRRYD